MTEKEKAKQITAIFREIYNKDDTPDGIAKACAIYCIEMRILDLVILQINEFHDAWVVERMKYLKEVKQELENM